MPVAFVLGICVYHIAHQSAMQSLRQAGQNQEMVVFTQGIYEARELALARMQAEATQAGASGIVGVNVAVSNHVWGEHATEFLATGTAIRRLGDEHRLPRPRRSPPSPWGSTAKDAIRRRDNRAGFPIGGATGYDRDIPLRWLKIY